MQAQIDIILLITGILLLSTLMAFYHGLLPYPFGMFVLGFVLLGRIFQLKSRK